MRVAADEVSYNLRVLVRFEGEKGLMERSIKVRDLHEMWNQKYKESFGLDINSDAQGVLQDIHWSHGSIGYFPVYTLGNIYAAQFWKAYTEYDKNFRQTVKKGNFTKIRYWLNSEIYRYGSALPPDKLVKKVTGESLNSQYFLYYIKDKYLVQGDKFHAA
ncbi:MAG: hypothetical protein ABIA63_03160 [bacterium]